MKFVTITLFCIIISFSVHSQQREKWLDMLENPDWNLMELKPNNNINKLKSYNLSTLFIPRREFLGYIGTNFRRIYMYYTSISKDTINPFRYFVKGISLVGNNRCDFEGEINIKQVREYKRMHYGVDYIYKDEGIQSQGIVLANYLFKENPHQKHVGIFEGLITLNWFIDKHGILHYDDIERYTDVYKNNQYVGTWSEYGKDLKKTCNWGEYKIPFSGDLDIGACCFSPNSKYYKYG